MEKFETPYASITDSIASHAKWRPRMTAVVCGEQRRKWHEFNQAINRVANGLIKRGLRKGDKVSVLMLNSIEMLEIMMGTVKADHRIRDLLAGAQAPLRRSIGETNQRQRRLIDNLPILLNSSGSNLVRLSDPGPRSLPRRRWKYVIDNIILYRGRSH
jgi:hypothetical protein